MLEGSKINLASMAKTEPETFTSALNFGTVGGTGIPERYNTNKQVQEIKDYDVQLLTEGWKKGVVRKKPSDEDRKLFQAIVVVLKYKYGTQFLNGLDKI